MKRILKVYKNHFWDFYNGQTENVKEKIDYVFEIVICVDRIPKKFFKHVENGIYEIRILTNRNNYRIFCFFDDIKLIILLQGIHKKSQKLLRKDIEKAFYFRKKYFDEKKESKNDK